jgi:Ca2+-binding RTX toxin-like protein
MATASEIKVTEAYIGLFGRAPNPEGLAYWVAQLDAAGGTTDALKKLTNDMTLNTEWTVDGLGANKQADGSIDSDDADVIVEGMYQNLFQRAATADDLEYWGDQLVDGTVTASEMVILLIAASQEKGNADSQTLALKEEAASYYAANVDEADFSRETAKSSVSSVDSPNSVADSKAATDAIASGTGITFALTAAATDAPAMTGGDDTITGTSDTMQAGDSISDGSTVDNDSLTITADDGFTFGTVANVENINVNLSKIIGSGVTIAADKMTGGTLSLDAATEVDVDGTDVPGETVVTVSDLASDISTTDVTSLSTTLDPAASVTITGDADLKTLDVETIDSNDTSIVIANNDSTITIGGTANSNDAVSVSATDNSSLDVSDGLLVEAVTLSGNGSAVDYAISGATGASMSYTVAGDQDVTLTGTAAQFTSAGFTDSSTAGDTTVVISDGATTDLTNFGVVDGGVEVAGDSAAVTTLTVASGNTVKVSADQTVGALTIDANDAVATTAMTLDVDNDSAVGITIEDIETLQIDAGSAALSLAALDMDANDAAVTYVGLGNLTATNVDTGSLKMTTGGLSATTVDALDGTLVIDATNDVTLTGVMTAQNDITITADDITLTTVTDTDGGVAGVNTTSDALTLTATNDIGVTTATTFEAITLVADGVATTTLTADNDITITATNEAAVGTVTSTQGDITISASEIDGTGVTATAGDVTLIATNDSGSLTSTIGTVSAAAGTVATSSGTYALTQLTGDSIVISGDAKVTATATDSTGSIVITSSNDVNLGDTNAGAVTVVGGSDVSAVFTGATLTASTVTTGTGNDTLTLNDADAKFIVSTGDNGNGAVDTVTVSDVADNSSIDMGDGNDVVNLADDAANGLTVDMGDGVGTVNLSAAAGTEAQITFGSGTSDVLNVDTGGAHTGVGFTGVEEVDITGVDLTLTWEALSANDTTFTLTGGAATDELILTSTSTANQTGDTINLTGIELNGLGVASLDVTGGDGNDTITGSLDLINDLNGGAGVDIITGGGNADILAGDAGDDTISGGAGADAIDGGADDDSLTGGSGVDAFTIGAGDDSVTDFGNGQDTISVATGATAAVAVTANYVAADTNLVNADGAAAAVFTVANDIDFDATLEVSIASGITITAAGNSAASILKGTDQADIITGGSGDDTLEGEVGADTISGGAGDDTIAGDAGADIITGGAGSDIIAGGADADVLVYNSDSDGGVAGTSGGAIGAGGDVVTWVAADDSILLDGDFLTGSLTGTTSNGVTSIAEAAGYDFDAAGLKSILIIGKNAARADLAANKDETKIDTAFGAITNEAVGDERIVVLVANDDSSVMYKFTSVTADNAITADELVLLGSFDTTLVIADFTFA